MRGTTAVFQQNVRVVGSPLRQMVEAYNVALNGNGTPQESIKKLKADWDGADSLTGLTSLLSPNDGVQLAETSFTALDHSTVTAGQYATQLNKGAASFQVARIALLDVKSAQVEVLSVTVRLNPAQGGTQQVATWSLQLCTGFDDITTPSLGLSRVTLIPLCDPLPVAALATEGDVLFDWSGKNPKPRPKVQHLPPGFAGANTQPTLYAILTAQKADGSPAANVGWACESVASYTQNSDKLQLVALTQTSAPSAGLGTPDPAPGSSWWLYAVSVTQTPRFKLLYNTGTAATITFSGANKPDLGGVPTATVEFTGQGEIPAGSSITYQVQADDATYLSFTDGATTDTLTVANPTHPITKRQTYILRATLNPSATSDATPTLRALGVRALTLTDLSDVAEVTGGDCSLDVLTHKSSIVQATLSAIRDGDPDYRDAITNLVANTPAGNLEIRVYRGSRNLARGDWLLQRTFLVDDVTCPGPSIELSLISPLALVRGQLPVYNPGTGLRQPLRYAGSTITAAFADIRDGQLAVPARYKGSGPSDTTIVGKLIPPNAQAVVSSYALLRSSLVRNLLDQQSWQTVQGKDELDNLAFLAGDALIESQGKIKCVSLCEGTITAPSDTGTASAVGASTLTDGTKSWVTNQWAGGSVTISGQTADVLSNTATVLTISGTWTGTPSGTYTVTGIQGFALTPEGIVAAFGAEEVLWGRVSPGFAQRVPEVYVPWNWNVAAQRLEFEYRAFNAPALLNLGNARIDSVQILPTDLGQWVTSDGTKQTTGGTVATSSLARRTAVRHATLFGGGLLQWEFETTYEYPELEEGDLVAVPTAYFVANNPITSTPISGWLMAVGKIVGTDLTGRKFKLWIRRWNDLSPSNSHVVRQSFAAPKITALAAYIDYASVATISLLVTTDAKAVRIASSSSGTPSDATARAAGLTTLDANGLAQNVTLITCPAGGSVYAKAFAYENADGTGTESLAATLQVNLLSSSTSLNGQGSVLPTPAGKILSWNTGGGTSGHMWIAIALGGGSYVTKRPDQSNVTIVDPNLLTRPAAPTISSVAGGALALRSRFVRVAYVKKAPTGQSFCVYRTSPESGGANNIPVNTLLKVIAPPAVAGYDGWVVWVGSATGTEVCQQQLNGVDTPLAFGADWTEPVGGAIIVSTSRTPYNAAMDNALTVGELLAAQAYALYVYFDLTVDTPIGGAIRIGSSNPAGLPTTVTDVVAAAEQNGDAHIPLSFGVTQSITTPAAAGTGSGSGQNANPKYL